MNGGKHGDDNDDGLINRLDPTADAYEQRVIEARQDVTDARRAGQAFLDKQSWEDDGPLHLTGWAAGFTLPDPVVDELGELHWPEPYFTGQWAREHAEHLALAPRAAARTTGLTAQTLLAAMGGPLTLARYQQLLAPFSRFLVAAGCTTVPRAAMAIAQTGHEAVGLRYAREIWGPSKQQRRYDAPGDPLAHQLGNRPGDGYGLRGAGWLQVTGRTNFGAVSRWGHQHGYCPTPTFFLDHPDALGSDQYVWLGPTWYWTVARPDINQLCDRGDLDTVTRRINGGLTGIDDRRRRYRAAFALGAAILPALAGPAAPAGPDPAIARRRRQQALILGDPVERAFGPGDSTHRIVCPTGKASKIVASSWLSASVAGRARVQVWAQIEKQGAAFPEGAGPKEQAERDWALYGGDRPPFELPDGTEMVTVQVTGSTGFGSLLIEQQAK